MILFAQAIGISDSAALGRFFCQNAVFKRQTTICGNWHVHEEIDVVRDIAFAHAKLWVFRHRQQPAVTASMHVFFAKVITHLVTFRRTRATQGVMSSIGLHSFVISIVPADR